ncbi:MAG: hypothetical protein INR63_11215 [Actinomycetospora chiangmaiensis]|nr:hypothetical protein [Actinomycetospora chiangmaiensis]
MSERRDSGDRDSRRAAAVQLFVRRYGRVAGAGGRDPNDRAYDRRVARAVERMSPERLDALLCCGEDDGTAS